MCKVCRELKDAADVAGRVDTSDWERQWARDATVWPTTGSAHRIAARALWNHQDAKHAAIYEDYSVYGPATEDQS